MFVSLLPLDLVGSKRQDREATQQRNARTSEMAMVRHHENADRSRHMKTGRISRTSDQSSIPLSTAWITHAGSDGVVSSILTNAVPSTDETADGLLYS
jgi:hypothetical protein